MPCDLSQWQDKHIITQEATKVCIQRREQKHRYSLTKSPHSIILQEQNVDYTNVLNIKLNRATKLVRFHLIFFSSHNFFKSNSGPSQNSYYVLLSFSIGHLINLNKNIKNHIIDTNTIHFTLKAYTSGFL